MYSIFSVVTGVIVITSNDNVDVELYRFSIEYHLF